MILTDADRDRLWALIEDYADNRAEAMAEWERGPRSEAERREKETVRLRAELRTALGFDDDLGAHAGAQRR